MPRKKPLKSDPPRWKWAFGWRAAGWSVLCAEGILAGGDRPCLPSFNLELLLHHMLLMHALGVAEVLWLFAAVPAFVVAATPKSFGLDPKRRNATLIGLALAVLVLQLFVNDPVMWVPVLGLAVGLAIRWYPWMRTYWLPLGLITATALGVIQFSGLQYAQSKCWP